MSMNTGLEDSATLEYGNIEYQDFGSEAHLAYVVIFTSVSQTLKAYERALDLAKPLGAGVIVLAVQVIPFALPIDEPPVSFEFIVDQFETQALDKYGEPHIVAYLCRDPLEVYKRILNRFSPVVIGTEKRKRWLPTREKRLARKLRRMGIRTVMITGDNPLTAAAIAGEAGVDDFLAQATPKAKLEYIKKEQTEGRLVAMTGDGTNDAPALAQADVGLAMNTGTMAAKEAGNMVDLDSNPTKLIEVVAIGKQLLITRGALTTFSIANDIAKYFAIIPAMFMATYPALRALNIMGLHTPESAVLSAVIFNALIIIALVPLALRGVKYRPVDAASLLRRNMLIYGLGGIIAPFPGIWIIDQTIHALGWA
jgi:soluble P-type ATPase